MSQAKVDEYKAEKAGRRQSLKKKRRIRNTIVAIVIIAALAASCGLGYYYGHKNGYNKGYTEGINTFENYFNKNSAATGSAVSSDSAVSGAAETDSTGK